MILELLQELEDLSEDTPVVVEGKKDIAALWSLGIRKNVVSLGRGLTVFAFCEKLAQESGSAIVLTDWDRKGGKLARMLKDAFEANGVKVNTDIRAKLVLLTKKDIKDIESLPTYIRRLRTVTGRP